MADLKLFVSFKPDKFRVSNFYRRDLRRIRHTKILKKSPQFYKSRAFLRTLKIKDNFSLSHTKSAVAILSSKDKVGVDIEQIKKRDYGHICEFCFSEKEKMYADNLLSFYQVFTIKEALIKALNLGFSDFGKICIFNDYGFKYKSFVLNDVFIVSIVFKLKKDIIIKILD